MSPLFKSHLLIAVTATALLVGCSSGGESGTGAQAGNQTTVGEVTGFGSVYVSGIKFNTDNATVTIDGVQVSDELSLSVGMVVAVQGSVNSDGSNGTANTIVARTEVEGLVFQNNIGSDNTVNVMGQTVIISNDTKFKSEVAGISVIEDLVAGSTVVEVSGYSDGQGNIYATYVKATESGSASEVKLHGVISNLSGDANSGSFNIGNTTVQVNYDGTTNFEDFPGISDGSGLANGVYVSVKSANYSVANSSVQATEIEKESSSYSEGGEFDIEGIVTNDSGVAAGSGQFVLNNRVVIYDINTQFEGGIATDITMDIKLEVDGTVQADGSILADEIDFREESDNEIEGAVVGIDNDAKSLTINDGVTTLTVFATDLTSYEDETNPDNRTFNFGDIVINDNIEAKYYVNPDMVNIATSIEKY